MNKERMNEWTKQERIVLFEKSWGLCNEKKKPQTKKNFNYTANPNYSEVIQKTRRFAYKLWRELMNAVYYSNPWINEYQAVTSTPFLII